MTDSTGRVFDALADPNRRYVVEALAERGTATATELAGASDVFVKDAASCRDRNAVVFAPVRMTGHSVDR